MKINFSVTYLLAFLSLLFLVQELHDWSHVLASEWICGCFGTKTFDSWTVCDNCEASGKILVLSILAGPTLTYILVWISWSLMGRGHSAGTKSFGLTLLFAANPFVNILAAFGGGGDITEAMRRLYQNPDGSNRHVVAIFALLIVLVLTVPPILRAIQMIKGNKEKLILIPAFLLLPNFMERLFVFKGMNWVLQQGIFQEEAFAGASLLVVVWLFILVIVLLASYKSILIFVKKKERKNTLRI
ncbi:MAG TPA: hypothetical protein VNV85_06330 [Puia sp.]|jgi:hypothetical protein|nr:hypothetical protein [Puia sp.]